MTSAGIRYSNIEPDQETSAGAVRRPASSGGRGGTSATTGTSPLAMATKLASRASEASRSYRAGIEAAVRDAVADREDLARGVEEEAELHRVEQLAVVSPVDGREAIDERLATRGGRRRASRWSRRRARSSSPCPDAVAQRASRSAVSSPIAACAAVGQRRPGPGDEDSRAPSALGGLRRRGGDADSAASRCGAHGMIVRRSRSWLAMVARVAWAQTRTSGCPRRPRAPRSACARCPRGCRRGRRADAGGPPRSAGLVGGLAKRRGQRLRGSRRAGRASTVWVAPVVGEAARRLPRRGRARPRCRRTRRDRAADGRVALATGVAEDEQMTGEVAAVDGGHVAGLQRAEVGSCRTSCRSGRGSARGGPSSRASPRAGRGCPGARASRSRARRPSTAGRARCSWATCDARRRASDPPGSCPAAGSVSADPTKVSKNRHVRRAVERRVLASAGASRRCVGDGAGRPAHPSGRERREAPEQRGTARRPRRCPAAPARPALRPRRARIRRAAHAPVHAGDRRGTCPTWPAPPSSTRAAAGGSRTGGPSVRAIASLISHA